MDLRKSLRETSRFDALLPFRAATFVVLLVVLAYLFGRSDLAEKLSVYIYFLILIGALMQIWELQFNKSIVLTLNREVMLILLTLLCLLEIFRGF